MIVLNNLVNKSTALSPTSSPYFLRCVTWISCHSTIHLLHSCPFYYLALPHSPLPILFHTFFIHQQVFPKSSQKMKFIENTEPQTPSLTHKHIHRFIKPKFYRSKTKHKTVYRNFTLSVVLNNRVAWFKRYKWGIINGHFILLNNTPPKNAINF